MLTDSTPSLGRSFNEGHSYAEDNTTPIVNVMCDKFFYHPQIFAYHSNVCHPYVGVGGLSKYSPIILIVQVSNSSDLYFWPLPNLLTERISGPMFVILQLEFRILCINYLLTIDEKTCLYKNARWIWDIIKANGIKKITVYVKRQQVFIILKILPRKQYYLFLTSNIHTSQPWVLQVGMLLIYEYLTYKYRRIKGVDTIKIIAKKTYFLYFFEHA